MKFFTLIILCVHIFWGCSHLQRGLMAAKGSPFSESELSQELGKSVFEEHCARCHGTTGMGDRDYSMLINTNIPDFTDGSYSKSLGITAANITYGKRDKMPAFNNTLSEREIWSVATFILSLNPDTRK